MTARLPPGRAGRLRLLARLDSARRAATLLDRKERLLRAEERRLAQLTAATGSAWDSTWREAAAWAGRAAVLGGQRDLSPHRLGAPDQPVEAKITWRASMGIEYPEAAQAVVPPAGRALPANPALASAAAANRRAVAAAISHAAASCAFERVQAELAATRRRRRAIADRLVPRLDAQLAELETRLDELEREEHTRIRWTQGRRP